MLLPHFNCFRIFLLLNLFLLLVLDVFDASILVCNLVRSVVPYISKSIPIKDFYEALKEVEFEMTYKVLEILLHNNDFFRYFDKTNTLKVLVPMHFTFETLFKRYLGEFVQDLSAYKCTSVKEKKTLAGFLWDWKNSIEYTTKAILLEDVKTLFPSDSNNKHSKCIEKLISRIKEKGSITVVQFKDSLDPLPWLFEKFIQFSPEKSDVSSNSSEDDFFNRIGSLENAGIFMRSMKKQKNLFYHKITITMADFHKKIKEHLTQKYLTFTESEFENVVFNNIKFVKDEVYIKIPTLLGDFPKQRLLDYLKFVKNSEKFNEKIMGKIHYGIDEIDFIDLIFKLEFFEDFESASKNKS